MQSHNLKRNHPNKKNRRVGRGGKHAKTSGRGTKGQNARSGHKKRPEIRDFIKRIPKLRGRGKNINTSIELKPTIVSLETLNKVFKDGDIVSPEILVQNKIVRSLSGNLPKVKILGNGKIDKKLTITGCLISSGAKLAIEKSGGKIM